MAMVRWPLFFSSNLSWLSVSLCPFHQFLSFDCLSPSSFLSCSLCVHYTRQSRLHTYSHTCSRTHTQHLRVASTINNTREHQDTVNQPEENKRNTVKAGRMHAEAGISLHFLAARQCVSTLCWGCCSSLLQLQHYSSQSTSTPPLLQHWHDGLLLWATVFAPLSAELQPAILLHSTHHMTGLASVLFAKLIDTIKVWSGDVIQFNFVLMACLRALSACVIISAVLLGGCEEMMQH